MAEFQEKQATLQKLHFPHTKPLPGVPELLFNLSKTAKTDTPVYMALATSSHARNFDLKTSHLTNLFALFPPAHRVLGDDPRIGAGRGKPLPDIYLLALETINKEIRERGNGESEIEPEECLVFEDAVPGVEAARRAGMRVVWVPHSGLLHEYRGRESEVLAGLTGEHKELDDENVLLDGFDTEVWRSRGSGKPGQLNDGRGELLLNLNDFNYERYGIKVY